MARKVVKHPVAKPLQHRMLGPEVMQLGPGVVFGLGLAGGLNRRGHARRVGTQRIMVVVGLSFTRQLAQTVLQVCGSGDSDDLLGIMGGPLTKRLWQVDLLQRKVCVLVVALEQRRRAR
jgi:hypothetical protein